MNFKKLFVKQGAVILGTILLGTAWMVKSLGVDNLQNIDRRLGDDERALFKIESDIRQVDFMQKMYWSHEFTDNQNHELPLLYNLITSLISFKNVINNTISDHTQKDKNQKIYDEEIARFLNLLSQKDISTILKLRDSLVIYFNKEQWSGHRHINETTA